MNKIAKVEGFSGLVRDLRSNAVLVSSQSEEYSEYRKRLTQKQRFESIENRILNLEAQNSEIKDLLKALIDEVRTSNVSR